MGAALAIGQAAGETVQPETWTLGADQVRAWAASAAAGAEKVYARERHLSRGAEGPRAAALLERQGFVTLYQRSRERGLRDYVMYRLKPQRAAIGQAPPARTKPLDGDMARVLRVIRDCARRGQPCPANRELGKRARVQNASYVMQKLADAGLIASRIVDRVSGARVVTITASGRETAEPGR